MSEDTPKGSTEPPDYEYGNVKLQYLPPPPELAEGQVYVKKSEFERRIHRGYAKYMKENPFVPLGALTILVGFAGGLRSFFHKQHDRSTNFMLLIVAGQIVTLAALKHGADKAEAAQRARLDEFMTDSK